MLEKISRRSRFFMKILWKFTLILVAEPFLCLTKFRACHNALCRSQPPETLSEGDQVTRELTQKDLLGNGFTVRNVSRLREVLNRDESVHIKGKIRSQIYSRKHRSGGGISIVRPAISRCKSSAEQHFDCAVEAEERVCCGGDLTSVFVNWLAQCAPGLTADYFYPQR